MKCKLLLLMSVSLLFSIWLMVAHASPIHAADPSGLKTITLQIEGMT